MQDALIMLTIFSVPLTALISSAWLKAKRIDAESGGQKLLEKVKQLESDNHDLKRRMEVLESIVVNETRRDGIIGARAIEQVAQEQRVEAVVGQR